MSAREETIERLREQAAAESEVQEGLPVEDDEPVEPEIDEEEKRPTTREYIVFMKVGPDTWKETLRTTAGTAASAIRTLGQDKLSEDGEYAACPSRNWSAGTPKIETTTSISISFK